MNRLERFIEGPLTASQADYLARIYGNGTDLDGFAAGLPESARVIDVGAGLSPFGAEVAARREDIHWINFDVNYDRPEHISYPAVQEAIKAAPGNLEFKPGNVLDLPEDIGSFDRVYSYNLVSHLIRINPKLGKTALSDMVSLLNNDGVLMVGPTNGRMATDARWKTTALRADAALEDVQQAEQLLTSSRMANYYYEASLASGVGLYPSGRFAPQTKGKLVLSNDGGQTFHGLFSKRGLALTGRLIGGLFQSMAAESE